MADIVWHLNINPYHAAFTRFVERQNRTPNALLMAPDCYAALQNDMRDFALAAVLKTGVWQPPPILLLGCQIYVVPGLPVGTVRAALVGE